jgi:uncharacterized membrane protein YebE (DUF533 family)
MDEAQLINGVLRSVLGGRRKRSKRALRYLSGPRGGSIWSNPTVLLTAAGVAWGIFETLQGRSGPASSAPAPATPAAEPPLPPLPRTQAPGPSETALRVVRLAVSAAHADGTVSEDDKTAIVEQARKAGVDGVVEQELAQPRPLSEIVAGVTDPADRAALYVLAFGIVRGDEQPSGAERIYLAKLAQLLGLDPPTVAQLEQNVGQTIDAQPA